MRETQVEDVTDIQGRHSRVQAAKSRVPKETLIKVEDMPEMEKPSYL